MKVFAERRIEMRRASITAACVLIAVVVTFCLLSSETRAKSVVQRPVRKHKVLTMREINDIYNQAVNESAGNVVQGGNEAVAEYLDKLSQEGWELFHSAQGYVFFRRAE